VGRDGEDEPEDLVKDLLRQPLVRLAHAGVIRHGIRRGKPEELAERPAVGAPPRDRPVRLQALEVADEQHPEEDARRHARPPHRLGVVRSTQLLDQCVEAVLGQQPIQRGIERMAGGLRQVGGRDEGLHLPLPASLPECHVPSWVCRSMSQARSQEFSALSQHVKPTLATAC
jgi:hypothetical protein